MNQVPHPRWTGPRYKHANDPGQPYETITVDRLTPIIGAEIGGESGKGAWRGRG